MSEVQNHNTSSSIASTELCDSASEFPSRYFGIKQPDVLLTESSIAQLAGYKRYFVSFIRDLPENARVLDVGCGSGKATKLIHTLRPDVLISGMDITDMREFLPAYVDFKKGSVDDLTSMYAAELFDAVVCQHVIEHLVTPLTLIEGIRKILKKGGMFYLETPNWTRLFVPFSHLYFWNDYTHIHPYGVTTMHRLFFDHAMKAKVRTVSSCVWFPRRAQHMISEEGKIESMSSDGRGFFSKIFARAVNPLLRDILIVVAQK